MLIVGALFGVFHLGSGAFRVSVLRQDLQSKARQVLSRLERELVQSSLGTLSVDDSPARLVPVDGGNVRRQALCLAALADWNDLTLYDPNTGAPEWNRYVLYHATREPQGRLIRTEIEPAAVVAGPWPEFTSFVLPEGPVAGLSSAVVADEVLEFSIVPDGKALVCSLKLRRQSGDRLGGQKPRDEVYQLDIEARPRNPLS